MAKPLYELSSDLFAAVPSRKQIRMMEMIEAAITSYAKHGIEGTTYESIAKICKVTTPLVHNYFPSKKKLFLTAAHYARLNMQRIAVAAIADAKSLDDQFDAYVRSTFAWLERFPDHGLLWHLFVYEAARDATARKALQEFVERGRLRIIALLEAGEHEGIVDCEDIAAAATDIQRYLQGSMTSVVSEGLAVGPAAAHTLDVCRRLAGMKKRRAEKRR